MAIIVKKPGLFTTVQDQGRRGYMRYGVPRSGAMDEWSYRIACLLVGNGPDTAALEIIGLGPQLQFEEGCWISLCGGEISASANGEPIPLWRPVWIPAGSLVTMGAFREGAIAYMAVRGGFTTDSFMGSRSTYVKGQLPGVVGRSLRSGDCLEIGDEITAPVPMDMSMWEADRSKMHYPAWKVMPLPIVQPQRVRVIAGREFGQFDQESRERFLHSAYLVTSRSDRMGYRLDGHALVLNEPLEMRSDAVLKGTVQVPPDGRPIVLMSDSQTTGGYPRIAQVIAADLHILSQVPPGGGVRFTLVSLAEAENAYLERELALRVIERSIQMKGDAIG